jgi:ketosteroid isomerase-like protein
MMSDSTVEWKAPSQAAHPARDAALRSYDAVCRKAKDEWLDLFTADGWIEDPVGPSVFDPEGAGHHGRDGRSAFWDKTIANVDRFVFEITDSFAAGNECANYGTIHTTMNGHVMRAEGVFVYRVDDAGKLVSLRAIWEWDRAIATAHKLD